MVSKILVVEDSKSIREEICEILQFEGFEVIWAENGEKGLKKAKATLPNLIISDVSMPKLNGYDFLKELQKTRTTASIPFIFLSGKTELPDLRKGMNLGADDYLIKPVNIEELIKVVKRKLKKQQVIQDNINELVEENEYSLKEAGRMAKIGYWRYLKQTDILIWSDFIHEIYGTDPKKDTPTLNELYAFFDEESRNILIDAVKRLNTKGTPYDLELKLTTLNNEERWIRNIGESLYNNKNEIIGRRGVSQDITERKKIEEENSRIKDNYRRLFDNATISIWNEDFSLVFEQIDEIRKLDIPNIKIYLEHNPSVLFSIIEKIKVNNVNSATLKLFKAKSSEEFLDNIQDTFGKGADKVFTNLIESIWYNEKIFISEVNYRTLKGDEFRALLSIPIPQTGIEQKTVPVSIQSIQSIKDAESAKIKSLHNLNKAQKLARVGSWLFNTLTKEIEWSDETFNICGLDPKKGAPAIDAFIKLIHTDDQELFINAVYEATNLGKPYDLEHRICLPNNEQKIVRGIGQPVFGENGEVIGLAGTCQDITSQRQATYKIKKAEELYRLLADNSNDIICLNEVDSTFKYISPSVKALLDYKQSDFSGKQVFGLIHKDDLKVLKNAIEQKMFSGDVDKAFSCRVLHKKGHYIWFEFLTSPVYEGEKISYFVTSARDITQRMLAKQKIQEYQTSLQKLTTEITLIEEKQKQNIASNIHDHLSQSLVISKMRIDELKKNPQLKMIDEDLNFIEKNIAEALKNSRKITYELSPPVLYQLGIIDAIEWLLEDVEVMHNIACTINSNIASIKLDDVKSILLYRSIQEVINNTIKYANATLITVDLNKTNLGLTIIVTDNGNGFNTNVLNNYNNHSGSGFGLFTIKERLRNIQGKFTISSILNTGTTINFFIPLSL